MKTQGNSDGKCTLLTCLHLRSLNYAGGTTQSLGLFLDRKIIRAGDLLNMYDPSSESLLYHIAHPGVVLCVMTKVWCRSKKGGLHRAILAQSDAKKRAGDKRADTLRARA